MKKILFALAVALLTTATASAQVPGLTAPASSKSNSETKVFAMELGTGFSYDVGAKAANPTQTVSAVFGLTDAVQAGFTVIKGDTNAHSFNLVKISVYPVSDLSVVLDFGGDAANAIVSGFGVAYNVFRNNNGGLTTALQFNTAYLFNNITAGNLAMGLNLKIGL